KIADAGPWIAVAFGWCDRRCGCRLEQFEVHLPIADEDDLAFAEGDHARPHEAEMARVESLDGDWVRTGQRNVVESDFRHRSCLRFLPPQNRRRSCALSGPDPLRRF